MFDTPTHTKRFAMDSDFYLNLSLLRSVQYMAVLVWSVCSVWTMAHYVSLISSL